MDTAITRLEITRAMLQSSKNMTDINIKYQDLTVNELLVLLDKTYGPNDYPATNSVDDMKHTNVSMGNVDENIIYQVRHTTSPQIDVLKNNNHYQRQYDCEDKRTIIGSALSVLTSYTDDTAMITGSFNYPEDLDKNIRDRRTNQCLSFEHESTIKRHDVLISLNPREKITAQVCTLTETNPSGTESVRCNAFGANTLTMITTFNEYEGTDSSKSTQFGTTGVTLLFTYP